MVEDGRVGHCEYPAEDAGGILGRRHIRTMDWIMEKRDSPVAGSPCTLITATCPIRYGHTLPDTGL